MAHRNLLLILACVSGSALIAQTMPGRYIVELGTEPVAEHVQRTRSVQGLRGAAASAHRRLVRAEQDAVGARIAARQFAVVEHVDTVANALIVDASDAAQLKAVAGVKKVYPVRLFHRVMDRAVQLHKVTDAWSRIGGSDQAGAGVKIAIVDTGIDITHPAFQNSTLAAPDGFPKVNDSADAAYTNGKVIVARSYVSLLQYRDPDSSARDHMGHGTALASVAAGLTSDGPLATITGVAPRAWIGNYKVFGTPGYNDYATDAAILKALDDAVADGMDIVSLSLGSDYAPRLADDVDVQAVERAVKAGVIVVVASGNNGADLNTISSPGTAPSVITAGASTNDRKFAASVEVSGIVTAVALPGNGPTPSGPVTAEIADVAALDGNGLACSSLPSGSLSGKIALILRGSCTFAVKLANAASAGAVGGVVYATATDPAAISMNVTPATLPAEMISNGDGSTIAQALAGGTTLTATMRFTLGPVPAVGNQLTTFSGAGPNVDLGIKPDLLAVGQNIYVGTQRLDMSGDMYDPSGYLTVDGTSFSTPLIAGAAALVKGARPGLTVDQYRSLLVHSAAPLTQSTGDSAVVQLSGAGILNVDAALQAAGTVSPVSLSFGAAAGGTVNQALTITNVGTVPETFNLGTIPLHGSATPALSQASVQLDPGASATVPVSWDTTGLAGGTYDGAVTITAASTGFTSRVPYWYAAPTGECAHVTLLGSIGSGRRGTTQSDAIDIRVTDVSGVILTNPDLTVTAVSGGGGFRAAYSYDSQIPGLIGIDVSLSRAAGANVFRIACGTASLDVTIAAQ